VIRPHYVPLFQSICLSKKMARLPDDTCRLFYTLLLTHLDSHGRIEADAETLDVKVWPKLRKGEAETERVLQALALVGLVKLYDARSKRYLEDAAWEEHAGSVGKPERRGASVFPAPPSQDYSCESRTTPADSGTSPPRARVGSARIGSEEGAQGDSTSNVDNSIEHWRAEWARTRPGTKATVRDKDRAAVAWMLEQESPEVVRARMTAMLEDPEPFVLKNASLRLLESKWDAYAVAATKNGKHAPAETAEQVDVRERWTAREFRTARSRGGVREYPGFETAKRELELKASP
jgi:hypothetical protein